MFQINYANEKLMFVERYTRSLSAYAPHIMQPNTPNGNVCFFGSSKDCEADSVEQLSLHSATVIRAKQPFELERAILERHYSRNC